MEESTAEPTAATAYILKLELKKLVTEILSHGEGVSEDSGESDGSSGGVLKAINDAIRILNRMREGGSKKPESDIPSSSSQSLKVEVPKEFKCKHSNEIMIEPTIIASGHNFEKKYITEWLKHEEKCPKSNEVLSHTSCAPNHLLYELITKWCLANGYERPKPPDEVANELSNDGIESLLQRISSPSSDEDQIQAAKEIRRQTNRFPNVRDHFVALHPRGITDLIRPLSDLSTGVSTKPELQENIITTLFNISIVMENVEAISQTDKVIPLLRESLTCGTMETRRNSASTLLSLLAIASNKVIIGESSTFTALGELIREGDMITSLEAGSLAYHLCLELECRETAISAGVVRAIMGKIPGRYEAQFLGVLVLLTTQESGVKEMEVYRGFMSHLFRILRERSCLMSCDFAVVIVLNMCNLATAYGRVVNMEENEYGTFTTLTKEGSSSESLVTNAQMVLEWLKWYTV